MKKIVLKVLILAMIISSFPGIALADNSTKIQNVLEMIKPRIPDTKDYEEFESNINEGTWALYGFSWYDADDNKSLNIKANEDGIITDYRFYDYSSNYSTGFKPSFNKLSSVEALEKTKELVKNLNPDIYDSLLFEETGYVSLFDDEYNFSIKRIENGILVYGDTGYVRVDSTASKILTFSLNYTYGLDFSNADNIINEEKAWEIYKKEVGMELLYMSRYEEDSEKEKIYLAYRPKAIASEYINAKTGQIEERKYLDNFNYKNSVEEMVTQDALAMGGVDNNRLTEEEIKELEEVFGLISKEEAQKILRNYKILDLPDSAKLSGTYLYKSHQNEDRFYNLEFREEKKDYNYRANATVNAKTSEIIYFSANRYYNIDKTFEKYSREEIEDIVYEYLGKLSPKHFNKEIQEYRIDEYNEDKKRESYVSFSRFVNGVRYINNGVEIEINPDNKKVKTYILNHSDNLDFPSLEGALAEDEAIKELSKSKKLELYYIPTTTDENKYQYDSSVLGYVFDDFIYCQLDPFTGEIIDDNEPYQEKELTYNDIENHYAKNEIKMLAKYGIGFEEESFRPDDYITIKDYTALLVRLFLNYEPIVLKANEEYNYEIDRAKRIGILDKNDNPDETLTREKAAIYMIRAIGAEEYAKLLDIYKKPFPDVTENLGYISLLSGMKVFNGDDLGNFNPYQKLTRADAVIIIYNYLARN